MDLGAPEMRLYWDIAQFVLTGAIGIYVYLSGRAQVRREALSKLEEDIDGNLNKIETRLGKIEAHVEYAPTSAMCAVSHARISVLEEALRRSPNDDTIKRVHERIDETAQGLAALRGELSGITRLLTTIDGFLRDSSHARS